MQNLGPLGPFPVQKKKKHGDLGSEKEEQHRGYWFPGNEFLQKRLLVVFPKTRNCACMEN
jgi:hypothetical protein